MHLSCMVRQQIQAILLGGCALSSICRSAGGLLIQLELFFSVCLFSIRVAWHSLTLIAEVSKSRPSCRGNFQAFGHIMLANIRLAKTGYMTTQNQGAGIYTWPLLFRGIAVCERGKGRMKNWSYQYSLSLFGILEFWLSQDQ